MARYVERPPVGMPARYVTCVWTRESTGEHRQLVVPDGCVDLIWLEGRLELVGPDTAPRTVGMRGDVAGVRFRPGAAGLVLGEAPVGEVRDLQVPLEEWHGDRARRLADRLAGLRGARTAEGVMVAEAAARELERFTSSLLGSHEADPLVERVVAALDRPGPPGLASLARSLGYSQRQLSRRVTRAVGYGPEALHGVLRFQRAMALGWAREHGLAEIAARSGYADQAHLSRDFRRLAGTTPSALFAS